MYNKTNVNSRRSMNIIEGCAGTTSRCRSALGSQPWPALASLGLGSLRPSTTRWARENKISLKMACDWKTRRLARSCHTSCPYRRQVGRLHRNQPVCAQAPGGPPPGTRAGLPLLCETFTEWKLPKSNQKVQKLGPHSVAFLCDSKGPKLGAGMSRVGGRMDHDP